MDFRHEAANAKHCTANFSNLKRTSLIVPEVLWSQERILVMEFIEGGRVDDLEFLQKHGIDRNQVSCEISRIFSKMLFIDGSFHGDPVRWIAPTRRRTEANPLLPDTMREKADATSP